jgi:hypothetical protein
MATIEELSNALVKADAAGNTEDAKALADAIREMQAQPQEFSQGITESALQAAAPTIRGAAPYVLGGLATLALAPEAAAAGTAFVGGMGLMALTKFVGDPAVIGINRLVGTNMTTPSEAWEKFFDYAGVPKNESEFGRIIQSATESGMETFATLGIANALKMFGGPTQKAVADQLLAGPTQQLVGDIAAGGASEASRYVAEQLGGGEVAQTGAAITGGIGTSLVASLLPHIPQVFNRKARLEEAAKVARDATIRGLATDPEAARQKIATETAELQTPGVRPTSADISADEGLLGLQQARRNASKLLRPRDVENAARIAEDIGQALEPTKASPLEAQAFFAAKNQELTDAADLAYELLLKEGRDAEASMMNEAIAKMAANENAQRNNLIGAEEASARASRILAEAQSKIAEAGSSRAEQSKIVFDILKANEVEVKANAQKLYAIDLSIESGIENLAAKLKEADSMFSKAGEKPSLIKNGIKQYLDKNGNPIPQSVGEIRKFDSDLSDAIRSLNAEGKKQQAKALGFIRDGITQDLKDLEVYPVVAKANAAWADYSDKFTHGVSGEVLKQAGAVDEPKIIGQYLNKGVAEAKRLQRALMGNEAGLNAVNAWIVNKLDQDFLTKQATSEALNAWMNKDMHKEWFSVFPEAKVQVQKLVDNITTAAQTLDSTLLDIKKLKATGSQESLLAAAKQAGKQIAEPIRERAKKNLAAKQKEIADNAASTFLGGRPIETIGAVLQNKDKMAELLAGAKGNAAVIEGIKNAVKDYLNPKIRNFGKVVTSKNTRKKIEYSDLEASLTKMNKLMANKSDSRAAMEMIFSPEEIAVLDTSRRQLEVTARRMRGAGGVSPTSLNQAQEAAYDIGLANNTLGVIQRLARGITPSDLRLSGAPGLVSGVADSIDRLWRGDVKKRALELLDDALLDPQIAAEALRPINSNNISRVKSFLNLYTAAAVPGVFRRALMPFALGNTNSEQLGEGDVIRDLNYGYTAISKDGKKYRLYAPNQNKPIAIGSFNEVQSVASRKVAKDISK